MPSSPVSAQVKYTRNNAQVGAAAQPQLFGGGTPGNYTKVEFPAGAFGPTPFLLQPLDQWDGALNASTPIIAPAAYPAPSTSVKANYAAAAPRPTSRAQDAQLLVNVARAFLACAAGTDELVEARHSSLIVARATLKNAQTRQAAGTVTKVDVDRAELALVRAEQAEREAAFAQEQTYRALGTLVQTNKPFKVSPRFRPRRCRTRATSRWRCACARSFGRSRRPSGPTMQESKARAWRWAPSISAVGNAHIFNYDNFHKDRHSWAAGAQLDWLLFDGGTRDAARHQANARAVAAREQAALFADQVRDDLANRSADQLDTKRHGLEAAQRSVDLANETLELVRVQYEAGTGTQLDLLQAQDAVVSAKVGLAQAHFDVAAADLSLRYAAGTFPPK